MDKYDEISLFDGFASMEELKPSFKPLRLLSLFSGIGAFEKALDRIATPYDLVAFCEIDEHAARSYCAIHDESPAHNLGDITKVDEKALPKDIDVVTYGFPCQDISLAGNQKGLFNADGSKTRSGLFFDALRIIEATKPRVAIAENVKNLTGKKFREQFRIVLESLKEAGYTNYWAVLNAKHFGVPQNRERVFIVSIHNDLDSGFFSFPRPFPLEKRLKDLLYEVVDEKYYLSDKIIASFNRHKERHDSRGNGFGWKPTNGDCVASAILASASVRPRDNFIIQRKHGYNKGNVQELCPAITTSSWCQNNILLEPVALDEQNGYIRTDGCVGTITTDGSSPKHNNRIIETVGVWDGFNGRVMSDSSVVGTLTQNCGADLKRNGQGIITSNDGTSHLRVRKLTPLECFRLMGFDDEDFAKAEAVNSNTQLYKQAGNSIVVDVLEHLFRKIIASGVFDGRA